LFHSDNYNNDYENEDENEDMDGDENEDKNEDENEDKNEKKDKNEDEDENTHDSKSNTDEKYGKNNNYNIDNSDGTKKTTTATTLQIMSRTTAFTSATLRKAMQQEQTTVSPLFFGSLQESFRLHQECQQFFS